METIDIEVDFSIFLDFAVIAEQINDASDYFRRAEEMLLDAGVEEQICVPHKCLPESLNLHVQASEMKEENLIESSLTLYNKSLAYSPLESEYLGDIYAERSEIYFEQGFYKLALENLQSAQETEHLGSKLKKLSKRKRRCMAKIDTGTSKEDTFQRNKDAKKEMLSETLPANSKFPMYVADCLFLEKSDEFGNHIRTNMDLKVGTIIATEQHFVSSLDKKFFYKRCDYCKTRNSLNLFPCNSCTGAVYCSSKCREEAFDSYHKYMCGFENVFGAHESCILKLFCIGLNSFDNMTEFAEFLQETEDSDETGWDINFSSLTQKEINKKLFLIVNSFQHKMLPSDIPIFLAFFEKMALFTFTVLNITELGDILDTDEKQNMFRNFVFRQWKMIAQNYAQIHTNVAQSQCRPNGEERAQWIGTGILTLTNFFNHSCAPNIYSFYDGRKVNYMVVRPIKKGEQLFLAYGNMVFGGFSLKDRKAILMKGHRFVCQCVACKNPKKYSNVDLYVRDSQAYCYYHQEEFDAIIKDDLEAAMKHFRSICDYLDKNDANYPSKEIFYLHFLIQECIGVFCKVNDL